MQNMSQSVFKRLTACNILWLSILWVNVSLLTISGAHAELVINNEVNHPSSHQMAGNHTKTHSPQLQTSATMPTNASTPTDASIITLMQVMRINEQIDAIIQSQQMAIDILQAQTQNSGEIKLPGDDSELTDAQKRIREQIQGILGQSSNVLQGGVERIKNNTPTKQDLTQAYITAAKAHYTQAEVDAQIAFYNTPLGQGILDKRPQVTAEFMQAAMAKSMPDSEDLEETKSELEALLPQIRELIGGVL